MNKILLTIIVVVLFTNNWKGFSQTSIATRPFENGFNENIFDFWVGEWEAIWDEGGGKLGKGINHITKILDQKIIYESFEVLEGQNKGFKGTSISVFQPRLKKWKQAWADNQGGYYDFVGEFEGEKRIFKTAVVERNGESVVARMVFKDIKKDSFTWDWEASKNGGVTWTLLWRIQYKRVQSAKGTP